MTVGNCQLLARLLAGHKLHVDVEVAFVTIFEVLIPQIQWWRCGWILRMCHKYHVRSISTTVATQLHNTCWESLLPNLTGAIKVFIQLA